MPTLSGCCKNLFKIIICVSSKFSFSYLSHIYNEESNVYLKIAATRGGGPLGPPSDTEERPEAPPPLPRAEGGNHSCLTTDIGFGNMIPVISKRSLREGQSGSSQSEEPPRGATLRSQPQEPP